MRSTLTKSTPTKSTTNRSTSTGSTPIKSTSNINRVNTCTNEQVHYCSIAKAQFGVSLKLNTLQDYFHHSGSVQKACKSSNLVGCISSFKGGWVAPAANCSKFISVVACSLWWHQWSWKYLDVVSLRFASTGSASLRRDCCQSIIIVVIPLLESE